MGAGLRANANPAGLEPWRHPSGEGVRREGARARRGGMSTPARFKGTETYLTHEGLRAAVDCALTLERPLLVKGEPGTGKTLLAEAVAQALGAPLLTWHVKSTTRAQDGLYVYDTVQRLYDSRFGDGDVRDIKRYIRLGPLGQAFAAPERVVLLIDEVDKADLEFPNDLLHELDRMRFRITETDEEIAAAHRPVVIITVEQREGAAGRLPAPLRLPLHRVPRRGAHAPHRRRSTIPTSTARSLDQALRGLLRAARASSACASGPPPASSSTGSRCCATRASSPSGSRRSSPSSGRCSSASRICRPWPRPLDPASGRGPEALEVFFGFLEELRRRKVPVGTHEAVALAGALKAGLHDSSLEGFTHVARALLVHSETHLDAFDQAFAAHFQGVPDAALALTRELLDWLEQARADGQALSDEERALLRAAHPRRSWSSSSASGSPSSRSGTTAATAGSAPAAPRPSGTPAARHVRGSASEGRAGCAARSARSRAAATASTAAIWCWTCARWGSPCASCAPSAARASSGSWTSRRPSAPPPRTRESSSSSPAPPRKPNTRVVLLMDVGGSMDPHALVASRLFSAASKASHFKELRRYYFHNCVYGRLYDTARMDTSISVPELLHTCSRETKLVVVGDAMMAPYELYVRGGALAWDDPDGEEGLTWLQRLAEHFQRAVWLNPEPTGSWRHPTVGAIRQLFPMFPLTLEGLGGAVDHLTRGASARR